MDVLAHAVHINSPTHGSMTLYLSEHEVLNPTVNQLEGKKLEDIPVACEYPDVFPEDLPSMPLDHDIEFSIELQPGTTSISRRPYRMPPNELAELKK